MILTIFRDKADEWRWHLQADNNEIVSDSAEGYQNKSDCYDLAVRLFPGAEIRFADDA